MGIESLAGHNYISLITFRKSGEAVPTPVWFAESNGRLYIYSLATSGKVKRVNRNPRVQVAPCSGRGKALGPYFDAQCRLLTDAEGKVADALLNRKYPSKRVLNLFSLFRPTQRAFLEIVPT